MRQLIAPNFFPFLIIVATIVLAAFFPLEMGQVAGVWFLLVGIGLSLNAGTFDRAWPVGLVLNVPTLVVVLINMAYVAMS